MAIRNSARNIVSSLGGERYRSRTLPVMVCPVLVERDKVIKNTDRNGVSSLGGERYRSSETLTVMVCPVMAERDIGHQEH